MEGGSNEITEWIQLTVSNKERKKEKWELEWETEGETEGGRGREGKNKSTSLDGYSPDREYLLSVCRLSTGGFLRCRKRASPLSPLNQAGSSFTLFVFGFFWVLFCFINKDPLTISFMFENPNVLHWPFDSLFSCRIHLRSKHAFRFYLSSISVYFVFCLVGSL